MTDDVMRLQWKISSHSNEQGSCVEIAALPEGAAVRDSKHPHGGILHVRAAEFTKLLDTARDGAPGESSGW